MTGACWIQAGALICCGSLLTEICPWFAAFGVLAGKWPNPPPDALAVCTGRSFRVWKEELATMLLEISDGCLPLCRDQPVAKGARLIVLNGGAPFR